jgi:hypothetical protein
MYAFAPFYWFTVELKEGELIKLILVDDWGTNSKWTVLA